MHRQFFVKYLKIVIIFKLFEMREEILFNLHVTNGIYITVQNADQKSIFTRIKIRILVYLFVYLYKYCFPKISRLKNIFQDLFNDIYYVLFIKKGFIDIPCLRFQMVLVSVNVSENNTIE